MSHMSEKLFIGMFKQKSKCCFNMYVQISGPQINTSAERTTAPHLINYFMILHFSSTMNLEIIEPEGLLGDIKTANVFHHPVKAKI